MTLRGLSECLSMRICCRRNANRARQFKHVLHVCEAFASAPFANMPTIGVSGCSAARIAAVSTYDCPPYQRRPRPTHAVPTTAVTDFRAGPQRVDCAASLCTLPASQSSDLEPSLVAGALG